MDRSHCQFTEGENDSSVEQCRGPRTAGSLCHVTLVIELGVAGRSQESVSRGISEKSLSHLYF